ncbi:putative nonribosomal siderophore peptide synthase [Diplodia seriata]|uniref:Putative nonribosomal siderophore peptide synthase n=1 Tax=Diplodia seriata TaxID=420778 RepID=A0A0G2EUG7_9PEZI|nr:putative nonribosomal siderophore peptide synthase [Diplodia seriata]
MSFSTSFPALDTLHRQPLSAGQAGISNGLTGTAELHHDNKPAELAWNKATLARGSVDLTVDVVLEAAARLIAAFTGEDDVVFHYSLPPAVSSSVEHAPERFGVATATVEYEAAQRTRSCLVTTYPGFQHSYGDAQTDFSVDVLENGQTASFSAKPFVLRVELGSRIQLSTHYYKRLMSSTVVDQLLYVFQDVEASLLLGRGPKEGALSDALDDAFTWINATEFIDEWRSIGRPSIDHGLLPSIDEDDLAYVMYTSGSTGRPKGVKITHHAATCSIASHSLYLSARSTSNPARWFQFAAPTFDPSVMEIFVTFSTGHTLCSAERQTSLTDPEATITELGATVMMATPSMAAILNPQRVPTLKDLWVMGEAVNRRVIENFSSDSPARIERHGTSTATSPEGLLNAYGPTEGSINCTLVSNFSVHDRGSIIGKPLPTCAMFVIDAAEKDAVVMPLGFPGELVIGGPQVSAGYLNRPEETAKAFLESEQYGRLYRTGDRARVVEDRDGSLTIEYLGRLTTDQVKLSGRRVELGDIEAVVEKLDGVKEAVVVAHKPVGGGHGSEQVVACILPHADTDQKRLVKSCQAAADKWLQPHMRPSKYLFVQEIPRSRSGKIDRRSLGSLVEELWSTVAAPVPADRSMSEDIGLDEGIRQVVFTGIADVTEILIDDISPSAELLSG